MGRSCGNRHCPTCLKDKATKWLEKQTQRLLPVQHFIVTFTVPEELRAVLRANQRAGYNAIFAAGSATISALLKNPRHLGTSKSGFFGVLHTWGRDPTVYHPHVHFVVTGGGVSADGTRWLATPTNFLFPHAAACLVYKAKFADALREAGLYDCVPARAWKNKFVVDIQPVGDGRAVLKYLAPYVYRVAISDNRIVAVDETSVTFRYTPSKSNRTKTRTVSGSQFVRGFVQHVLPRGFQKVRYYGWMSPNARNKLELVRWLVWLFLGWTFWLGSGYAPQSEPIQCQPPKCADCGAPMRIIRIVNTNCRTLIAHTLLEHSLAFLDSG